MVLSTSGTDLISKIVKNNNTITYTVVNEDADEDINALFQLNLTDNSTLNTNEIYNFYIEDIINNNNTIYITDGGNIYKADLDDLTTSPENWLEKTDREYISNLTIDSGLLYFSDGRQIEKVSLTSTTPSEDAIVIATNHSITENDGYDTLYCSYFGDILIDNITVYSLLTNADKIVSFSDVALSNKTFTRDLKTPFYVKEEFYTLIKKM